MPIVIDAINSKINYFIPDPQQEVDKKSSAKNFCSNYVESSERCIHWDWEFKGTFSLQMKLHSKPYQALLRQVAYALQKPFKEEVEWLQYLDITTPLGIDKTVEWCKSFILVPKPNGKIRLSLDPARLNQALL